MIWPTDILSVPFWTLVTSLFLLIKYYIDQRWKVLKKWNIPHDPPSILNLGHVRTMFMDKPFTYPLECKAKYGPIYGTYFLLEPRLCIHDVEILRRVFITDFSNFPYRDYRGVRPGGDLANHGLLAVKGEKWKRIRTTLAPAFSSVKLKQMMEFINYSADNTLKVFSQVIAENEGIFAARELFARLSLDVICSAAFSTDVNSQDTSKGELAISKHASKFSNPGFRGMFQYLAMYFPRLEPFSHLIYGLDHVEYFEALSQRIAQRKSSSESREQSRIDLMQLMLDAKISEAELKSGVRKGLTSHEIIGNAMTMLIAGYETTATAMTYIAYNLAMHPSVQKKLQTEIDDMCEKADLMDFTAVNGLQYLEMCINETLRLYCPVAWTQRTAINGITVGGLTIPKGCVLSVSTYAMCHDPDFWKNPMDFQPERMRNVSEIDSMIFLPFGAGPRNCIGAKFAILEMKLAFSKILRHYSFEPASETPEPPLELTFGITTRPKCILNLRVVPR